MSFSAPQANLYKFTGTSAETKPTVAIQPGSIFTETDTLNKYIFGTDNTWHSYHDQSVMQLWQPSTLSYIDASADSSGNLNTTGSGGGGGGTVTADQGTPGAAPWLVILPAQSIVTDVANTTVTFVGKASTGTATSASSWLIFKLTTDVNGSITIQYANGSTSYNQIWNDRDSLSYS